MSAKDPRREKVPRIFTFEMRQDDPAKCTSAKLRRLGMARGISRDRIPQGSIVLNPSSGSQVLLPRDRDAAQMHGLVVIDCSWKRVDSAFFSKGRFRGNQRRLPALLAGNPTNYSKLGALSSLEAIAGAMYIMNFREEARRLLSIYKWGETFLSLNGDALEDYSKAETPEELNLLERSYFP